MRAIAVLLLLLLVQQLACEDQVSRPIGDQDPCCSKPLTDHNCSIRSITVDRNGLLKVLRTDRIMFFVAMSKENEITSNVSRRSISRLHTGIIPVAFKKDDHDCEFIWHPAKKTTHFVTSCDLDLKGRNKNVDQCDPVLPDVMRNLANCGDQTHDPSKWYLHHVGTFYEELLNSYVVGYYRRHEATRNPSDPDETMIIAWDSHGTKVGKRTILDTSGITAITGWHVDGRRERVISINDQGYMCFDWRPADGSLTFLPSWNSSPFMPQCVPANVLFDCPQSFCHTGLVDEVLYSEYQEGNRLAQRLTFFRGNFLWELTGEQTVANLTPPFELKPVKDTIPQGVFGRIFFQNTTVTAAITMMTSDHDHESIASQVLFLSSKHPEIAVIRLFAGEQYGTYHEATMDNFFGNETKGSAIKPRAAFFDESIQVLEVLTREKKMRFKIVNHVKNKIWNVNPLPEDQLTEEEKSIDGFFSFKGINYAKSGQFFWKRGSNKNTSIPLLHHKTHNPGGLISTEECGWKRKNLSDLFYAIEKSRSDPGEITFRMESAGSPFKTDSPTTTIVPRNQTTTDPGPRNRAGGIGWMTGIALLIWMLIFFFMSSMVWVYKNLNLLKKTDSADYY